MYLASGKIYHAESYLAPLLKMFPLIYSKESLATPEELAPFKVSLCVLTDKFDNAVVLTFLIIGLQIYLICTKDHSSQAPDGLQTSNAIGLK